MKQKSKPSFFELFWEFFKIGLFTIGGGIVMIPLISRIVVEDKKWITEGEMLDCVALSQALPGVIAINSASFIGYKKRGVKGGIMATIGVILPSFLIILALANILNVVNENEYVQGAMVGIKACVTGLVLVVTYNISKKMLHTVVQWVIAALAFVAVVFFNINAIIVVIAGGLFGIVYFNKRREEND